MGCSLVDGNGEGIMIEATQFDLEFVRKTSFGLLQVSFFLMTLEPRVE